MGGQYPQLQVFQKKLHLASNSAYDIYCGAGIKEGELGSCHTRGRPVAATKAVVRCYNHYGLSHKSLQRNDRRRSLEDMKSPSPLVVEAATGTKRKDYHGGAPLSRRRRSAIEHGMGLPSTYYPVSGN